MALSPNLKLRIDDTLTADARYNLLKIDSLGSLTKLENTGNVRIRSLRDLVLKPESEDLGGAGSGGTISLGETGADVDLVAIFATEVNFNGAELTDFTVTELVEDSWISPTAAIDVSKLADGSVSNTEFQYLAGLTGNIQAQINAISGSNQLAATWLAADGATKTINHGFGSQLVRVEVLDVSNNYATIVVDSITRPDGNTVQLSASEAPSTSWVVLISQVA